MNDLIEEKAVEIAEFFIQNKATVRGTAKHFGISKSTVHKYLTEKLKHASPSLYEEAKLLLDKNKAVRHLRGGEATKKKYQQLKRRKQAFV